MGKLEYIWRLWQCPSCRRELKVNYVLNEDSYNRLKNCLCGGTLVFIKDLQPEDKV